MLPRFDFINLTFVPLAKMAKMFSLCTASRLLIDVCQIFLMFHRL